MSGQREDSSVALWFVGKNLDYNVDRQSSAAVGCFRNMLHRFVNFTDINNRNERKHINNDTGKTKIYLGTSSPQRPHQGTRQSKSIESYLHCMLHPCCQKPSNPATFFLNDKQTHPKIPMNPIFCHTFVSQFFCKLA